MMVSERRGETPLPLPIARLSVGAERTDLMDAFDARTVDARRVQAPPIDFHAGADAGVEAALLTRALHDRIERRRDDDDLRANRAQLLHDAGGLRTETLLPFDDLIVEIA